MLMTVVPPVTTFSSPRDLDPPDEAHREPQRERRPIEQLAAEEQVRELGAAFEERPKPDLELLLVGADEEDLQHLLQPAEDELAEHHRPRAGCCVPDKHVSTGRQHHLEGRSGADGPDHQRGAA